MKSGHYFEILLAGAFVFLFIVFIMDRNSIPNYTVVRKALSYKEAMTDYLMPGDVDSSYSLLNGVFPLKEHQVQQTLNSQRCYEGDFQTRLEKTGNYIQRTNNYKRDDPESCSSPFQEFVTAYYKVEPLA